MRSIIPRLGRNHGLSALGVVEHYSMPEPNSGCWLWLGNTDAYGYGRLGPRTHAHRMAFEAVNGPLERGLVICHRCDTPCCVNPHHLFAGSHQDNTNDMMRKGRYPLGDSHQGRKISVADVLAIRSDSRPQKVIAKTYGLHQSEVSRIRTRKRWSCIDEAA